MTTWRRTKTKAPGVYKSVSGKYEVAYRDSNGRQVFEKTDLSFEAAKEYRAELVARMGPRRKSHGKP